ncbi:MAG: MFS transporter [Candidatus Omnitrophica bacterium]|nr:MFS transporter [Candidatus Omnitrophota bacterium]
MPRFRKVLFKRNFFFLWLGQIISQLGDRLNQMALIGLIYMRDPGSAMGIAKILSFTIIPVFLIGPIAGVYVDRWDRRRTMYTCDLLRALLVLAIPAFLFYSNSLVPIYIIVFIVFCIGRFFVPAKLSILPELVESKDLLIANSLVNTTGMIAAILGFGLSGIVVEMLGPRAGFYLDATSFFISAALVFSIVKKQSLRVDLREVGKEIVELISKSVFQEIKEGVLYFIRNKSIRLTAALIFILWAALGAVYVVTIVFVQKYLGSATKDLGLLVMFLGIGLFAGSLVYGRFGHRVSQYKTIFVSLVLSGIMLVVFALTLQRYPLFSVAAVLAFALGMLVAPIMIAANTIVHTVSDNQMLGKIFSSMEIVMHLGFLVFMLLSSVLAEKFSHGGILITVGVVLSVLGALELIFYRRMPWCQT